MWHGWAILLATCSMVLMCAAAHANGFAVSGPFGDADGDEVMRGIETLVVRGLVLLVLLAVGVVIFVVFVTWLICEAGRSREAAESEEAQAQLKRELADAQRRLDGAEKELEQYRKAGSVPPGSDPSEVKGMGDESEPGDEVGQPEPSEKSDEIVLPAGGMAAAGCLGAVAGFVLSAFLNMRGGNYTAEAAFGAVVGAFVSAGLWAAWKWTSMKRAQRGGS